VNLGKRRQTNKNCNTRRQTGKEAPVFLIDRGESGKTCWFILIVVPFGELVSQCSRQQLTY